MRARRRLALALTAVAAVLTAGAGSGAAEPVHFTPDEAVLACMARADREVARRHGAPARLAGRFETVRLHAGWRVYGTYLVGADLRLRVACDIAGGRVHLVAEPAAESATE